MGLFLGNTPEEVSKKYYEILIRSYGDNDEPGLQGWGTLEDQTSRFSVFANKCMKYGQSVLDFGAGKADLYAYLTAMELDPDYTSVEVMDYFVSRAKEEYGDKIKVHQTELKNLSGEWDWCFASGTFNVGFTEQSLLEHIDQMVRLSKVGVCFNLLETEVHEDPLLLTFNKERFTEMMIERYSDMKHEQITGYSNGDFTTCLYHIK